MHWLWKILHGLRYYLRFWWVCPNKMSYSYTPPGRNELKSNWNTYFLLCSIVTSLMSEQPHILNHPLQYNAPHFKYMQELEISNIKGCSWIIQFSIRNQVFVCIVMLKSIWTFEYCFKIYIISLQLALFWIQVW